MRYPLKQSLPVAVYYSMTPGSINRVDHSTLPSRLQSPSSEAEHLRLHKHGASTETTENSGIQAVSSTALTIEKQAQTHGHAKSDRVEISSQARAHSQLSADDSSSNSDADKDAAVNKLKAVDREVRAHERAHLAAAGGLARGGASFKTVKGPDGQLYAVAGEVQIDTSPVPGDPDATIRKAETIRRAALAPARPSGQDIAVAAAAGAMEAEARAEKARNKDDSGTNKTESSSQISPDNIRKVSEASETEPGNNQGAGGNDSKQNDLIAKLQKQLDPTEALGKILNLIA